MKHHLRVLFLVQFFFSLFVFVPFHFAIMHVTKSPSITSRLNLCDVFKSSYSFLQWNDSAVRNGRHKRTQDFSFLLFFPSEHYVWCIFRIFFLVSTYFQSICFHDRAFLRNLTLQICLRCQRFSMCNLLNLMYWHQAEHFLLLIA